MASHVSPLFVARASIAFTGLCEAVLCANDDEDVVIRLTCISGDNCGVILSSRISKNEGRLIKLEKARPLLEKTADEYSVQEDAHAINIMIQMRDKEAIR